MGVGTPDAVGVDAPDAVGVAATLLAATEGAAEPDGEVVAAGVPEGEAGTGAAEPETEWVTADDADAATDAATEAAAEGATDAEMEAAVPPVLSGMSRYTRKFLLRFTMTCA